MTARLGSPIPTNFTIDDEYGDSVSGLQPIYEPNWSFGPQCPGCAIQPEKNRTFDQTWHDTTVHPGDPTHNVTLMFNGTAIWVYCIIPNSQKHITTFVSLTFEVDGDYVGAFSQQSDDYMLYNITVYSNTSMENRDHTLVMTVQNDVDASVALFDWAQYTYDPEPQAVPSSTFITSSSTYSESSTRTYEPNTSRFTSSFTSSSIPALTSHSSSESSKSSTDAIAGGVIGGVSVLVLGLLAAFYMRHYCRGRAIRSHTMSDSTPRRRGLLERQPAISVEPFFGYPTTHQPVHSIAAPLPKEVAISSRPTRPAPQETYLGTLDDVAGASVSVIATSNATAESSSMASREGRARKEEYAARYGEKLMRKMRDMERQAAELRHHRSMAVNVAVDRPASRPDAANLQARDDPMEIRGTLNASQMELDQLREMSVAAVEAPPPAYVTES